MNVLERFLPNKTAAGLECVLTTNGWQFNYIILKQENGKLIPGASGEAINSQEIIFRALKGIPIALSISGKGLIHRKISWNESDSVSSMIHKALPGTVTDDFYMQQCLPFNGTAYVSIIRKDHLDNLLNILYENNLQIISLRLGPFSIERSLPLLDKNEYQFDFSFLSYRFSIVDQTITDALFNEKIENEDSIIISGETLNPRLIIAFSSGLGLFSQQKQTDQTNIIRVLHAAEEYRNKRKFRLAGSFLVILFLSLLGLNFFITGHYNKRKNLLQMEASANIYALNEYDTLRKVFSEKQEFLNKNHLFEPSRLSFYADDIARDIPLQVQLNELNLAPIIKKHADDSIIEFNPKQILVLGNCSKSIDLNDWMLQLKKKTWIRALTLLNYSHDKNNSNGEFSLSVLIR
jgi:hypothetical protein